MERSFKDALKHRRSFYSLSNQSTISDQAVEEIIKWALTYVPSAFNSQSTRIVLLLGEKHNALWEKIKEVAKVKMEEKGYKATVKKIDASFATGYGTVLFFEDQTVVENLQKAFPTYHDKFPEWSDHTSGMHQLAIWTMLEDAGLGASLQHYNPLIDSAVSDMFGLPEKWKLIAQMPFGIPTAQPDTKEKEPFKKRMKVFK